MSSSWKIETPVSSNLGVAVDKYRTYFDNIHTLKYKLVTKFKIPSSLIVLIQKEPLYYDSLLDYLDKNLKLGRKLNDIYGSLLELNPGMNMSHYVYAYIKTQDPTLENWQRTAIVLVEYFQKYSVENANLLAVQGIIRENSYNVLKNYMQVVSLEIEDKLKKETLLVQELDRDLLSLDSTMDSPGVFKHWKQTPTVVISRTIELYPKHVHGIVDPLYIFDKLLISQHAPYARLINNNVEDEELINPNSNNFYKMYTGPGTDNEDYYRAVTVSDPEIERGPAIYLTIWIGDSKTNIGNSDPLYFIPVLYNLKAGYITLSAVNEIRGKKIDGVNICIQRLRKCLPELDLGEPKEVKIKAEFNLIPIYPEYPDSIKKFAYSNRTHYALYHNNLNQFDLYEHVLNHLIMFYTVIGRNIYIEESVTPSPLKKRLDYHYRHMYSDIDEYITPKNSDYISNSANISFNLKLSHAKENSSWIEVDQEQKELSILGLQPGYNYIRVSISKAGSMQDLKTFTKILPAVLDIYWWGILGSSTPPQDLIYYENLVPSLTNLLGIKEKLKLLKKKTESGIRESRTQSGKMQELIKSWPNIFNKGYTKYCTAKRLPITVKTLEEAEKWVQITHSKGGKNIKRQYMPFPPPSISKIPLFYVICPDDATPYPSLIVNKTGINEEDLPVLPCCNARDQRTGEGNLYGQHYLGLAPQESKMELEHILSDKVVKFKQTGFLPYSITSCVRYYRINAGEFYRYGINVGPNALLDAVLFSVDSLFRQLETEEQRYKYILEKRIQIARDIKVECMRQELYDLTNEEIRAEISDINVPLDFGRHFRMLEYAFGINLVCFQAIEKFSTDDAELEIPRHLDFHIRKINPDIPTVLIFKHWGSVSDSLTYPHYELIIEESTDQYDNRLIFNKDMSELCDDVVEKIQGKITWIPDSVLLNPYSNIFENWPLKPEILENVRTQYIDSSGKRRAITWMQDGRLFTLWHLPNIPLNVPHTDKIERAPYNLAIRTFKSEKQIINFWSGYSVNKEKLVTGLWLTANNIPNVLYIPIEPIELKELTVNNPMMKVQEDPTIQLKEVYEYSQILRYRSLKRVLHIIHELILWVWSIAKFEIAQSRGSKYMEDGSILDIFISRLFTQGSEVIVDSLVVYDISRVQYVLPNVDTVVNAMGYLQSIIPSLVREGKFYLYNQKFYNGMVDMLRRYFNATSGDEVKINNTISNYYSHSMYFKNDANTTVWLGKDFKTWLEIKTSKYELYKIYRTINLSLVDTNIPYLYEDTDGSIYMIQNPRDGSIEAAATIAHKWKSSNRNIGVDVPEDDLLTFEEVSPVLIYGIGVSGNLVPIFDNTYDDYNYIELLYYGTNTISGTHLKLRTGTPTTPMVTTPYQTSGSFSTWGAPTVVSESTISSRYGALLRLL